MKQKPVSLSPRAALFIGAALLATPALAQDQTVAPPPVVTTVPAPAPAPAPAPTIVMQPSAPVVQAVPEAAPAEAAPARTTARRTAETTRRTTTQANRTPAATAPAPAPEAAAPVAEPAPPAPVTAEPAAPVETASTTQTVTETAPTEPTQNAPIWPWLLLGALVAAGAVIALLLRRRSDEDVYEPVAEPRYAPPRAERMEEPKYTPVASTPQPEVTVADFAPAAAAAAPILAEPRVPVADVMPEPIEVEAEAHDAAKEDLVGVVDGNAPVAQRPWLEFGMRPVRAGTTDEEATVEFELTVGNTGDVQAEDVHITTFMLTDAESNEMEQLLVQHANDEDAVPPVSIAPGEGTRVDATLATPKEGIGRMFNPIIVADARYKLPDGSEGRTAAAFRIGRPVPDNDGVGPIGASRPHMVDNLEAELEQVLERA